MSLHGKKSFKNTKEVSVQLVIFFLKVPTIFVKKMFNCLDSLKNEFAAKDDQKPVSGKTKLFFWGKRKCELFQVQDRGTRILG